jgi:hypothetical protein
MYSLIETAKANGHAPFNYLSYLFDTLPGQQIPRKLADSFRTISTQHRIDGCNGDYLTVTNIYLAQRGHSRSKPPKNVQ